MKCIFLWARSEALRIASGTALAFPLPKPMVPFLSPTTTVTRKRKRRPPLTTWRRGDLDHAFLKGFLSFKLFYTASTGHNQLHIGLELQRLPAHICQRLDASSILKNRRGQHTTA